MNPITNIRNLNKINQKELELGVAGHSAKSWHQKYRNSAWVFVGGLPYDLTEGDVIAVFSQYGEIVNINLVRDRKTGRSRGFGFVCFEDQRSTVLAVDNFNGIKLLGRMIRVDHVEEYKVPKYNEDVDAEVRKVWEEGCAPKALNSVGESREDTESEDNEVDKLLDKDGLLPLDEQDIDEELKEKISVGKKKKEKKKKKKKESDDSRGSGQERHLKRTHFEDEKRDLSRSWKEQRVTVVDRRAESSGDEQDFYGSNPSFNFGKDRKPLPPPPTHNLRPDFEKSDWRDIEMWKIEREREKAAKKDDDKAVVWKDKEHYLPSRFHRT